MLKWLKTGWVKKILQWLAKWLTLWLPLFMIDFMPVMADWLKNRDQVTIQDLTPLAVLSLVLTAAVTAVFFYFFIKNRLPTLLGAIAAVLILGQNHNRLLTLFTRLHLPTKYLYEVIIFLLLGLVAYILFYKFNRRWQSKTDILAKGILIAVVVAWLVQFYSLAKVLIIEWPQFFYRPADINSNLTASPSSGKPDIYYIVLDRYVSQNILTSQFAFDNSDFMNYLKNNGFVVNPDAYSNYPFTAMSIASTLNANYNSDEVKKFKGASDQTVQPYHNTIHYSPVIKKLKSLGYSYYHLGTWYEATSTAPLADYYYQPDGQLTIFNCRITLSDFTKKELLKNILWRVTKYKIKFGGFTVLSYSTQKAIDATLSKLDLLKKIAAEPAGGKFVFAHILSPHSPYFFNADGSLSAHPEIDEVGKPIKQKYTDQMQFLNSQMKIIIDSIKKNSNNQAVIILQSDEGEYPIYIEIEHFWVGATEEYLHNNMTAWPDKNLKLKYGILAAYHVPKATEQTLTTSADSANIFRLVFNTYFGANLPYLPKCYYAYPEGRNKPFVYADITKRLTGQADPACSNDSSGQ